jgi:hypothetical protein
MGWLRDHWKQCTAVGAVAIASASLAGALAGANSGNPQLQGQSSSYMVVKVSNGEVVYGASNTPGSAAYYPAKTDTLLTNANDAGAIPKAIDAIKSYEAKTGHDVNFLELADGIGTGQTSTPAGQTLPVCPQPDKDPLLRAFARAELKVGILEIRGCAYTGINSPSIGGLQPFSDTLRTPLVINAAGKGGKATTLVVTANCIGNSGWKDPVCSGGPKFPAPNS